MLLFANNLQAYLHSLGAPGQLYSALNLSTELQPVTGEKLNISLASQLDLDPNKNDNGQYKIQVQRSHKSPTC